MFCACGFKFQFHCYFHYIVIEKLVIISTGYCISRKYNELVVGDFFRNHQILYTNKVYIWMLAHDHMVVTSAALVIAHLTTLVL